MPLSNWSKHSFIVIAVFCTFGAFLVGSSQSQGPSAPSDGDIGRFQLTVDKEAKHTLIFDTKTGRFWMPSDPNRPFTRVPWTEHNPIARP